MPQIKTTKKYDFLVTFGCSFTTGHQLGNEGAWGHFLAKRLDCEHINKGGGSSNPNICTSVINFCEHNDMSNACVGIQWSEATRRELWLEYKKHYYILGLGVLMNDRLWSLEHDQDFLQPFKNNLASTSTVFFDLQENILRTMLAMIHVKSYLEYKGIDFIQFEGLNSILDLESYEFDHPVGPATPLTLTSQRMKDSILKDKTFFSELGDLNTAMRKLPYYNNDANDGHPHSEVLEYWIDNMISHIKKYET